MAATILDQPYTGSTIAVTRWDDRLIVIHNQTQLANLPWRDGDYFLTVEQKAFRISITGNEYSISNYAPGNL